MKARIYTDTSVLGGCEDDEFREASRRLFEAFERGELTLVLSELTVRELEGSPDAVRAVVGRVPDQHIEALALSQEAEDLASACGPLHCGPGVVRTRSPRCEGGARMTGMAPNNRLRRAFRCVVPAEPER